MQPEGVVTAPAEKQIMPKSARGLRTLPSISEGLPIDTDLPAKLEHSVDATQKGLEVPPLSAREVDYGSVFNWRKLLSPRPVETPLSARSDAGGHPLQSRHGYVHPSGALSARDTRREPQARPSSSRGGILDRMLDRVLFPAPAPTYDLSTFGDELISVPRDDGEQVPCLFIKYSFSRFVLIYLHANAEDIGKAKPFCKMMSKMFQTHVLAVEYPGYGVCPGEANESGIRANAEAAMHFVTESLQWPSDSIIIMGRSMGTGPAVSLAAAHPDLGGLVLVSPYTSIKSLIHHHVGSLAHLVTERFPSEEIVQQVKAPTLIIHGQRDSLIPVAQGQKLFDLLNAKKVFVAPNRMGHNDALFNDLSYLAQPMFEFFPFPDFAFDDIEIPTWAHRHEPFSRVAQDEKPCSNSSLSTNCSATPSNSISSADSAEENVDCLAGAVAQIHTRNMFLAGMSSVKPAMTADSCFEPSPNVDVCSVPGIPEAAPVLLKSRPQLKRGPIVKPIANFNLVAT